MSAIAGLWRFDGKPGTAADCERMLAAQEIYGRHDERVWSEGPVAVGRRLFRTLPEDIHDRQPLQTRDGRLTLVADIRIDNRNELAGALGLSDGEVRGFSDAAGISSLSRRCRRACTRFPRFRVRRTSRRRLNFR